MHCATCGVLLGIRDMPGAYPYDRQWLCKKDLYKIDPEWFQLVEKVSLELKSWRKRKTPVDIFGTQSAVTKYMKNHDSR